MHSTPDVSKHGADPSLWQGVPILLVDDNEDNRDLLARRLARRGCDVTTASSGEQALALARPDRFYLVLLDVMMPGMSGLEVLTTLRKSYTPADLPVIMVTARDQSLDVVRSLELGANDHVTKPIDFPVLFARIAIQLRLRALSQLKDEFVRVASHDLRNPLGLLAFGTNYLAQTLPPGTPMTPKGHALLQKMAARCQDMERIISDFLEFDALQEGSFAMRAEPMDFTEAVKTTLDNHRALAEAKSVRLGAQHDPMLGTVRADRGRIAQVLDNLVNNAIKYGRPGDDVVVHTRRDGDAVQVEVVDSGPGVPESEIGRLFEKYSRLSNRPTGNESSSGLGLFICRRIVELHGGQIGAHNNANGRGATFWFRLALPSISDQQETGT